MSVQGDKSIRLLSLEALVLGGAVPPSTRVQSHKLSPSPNSDDVDFYAKWRDGADDLNVDAIVGSASPVPTSEQRDHTRSETAAPGAYYKIIGCSSGVKERGATFRMRPTLTNGVDH